MFLLPVWGYPLVSRVLYLSYPKVLQARQEMQREAMWHFPTSRWHFCLLSSSSQFDMISSDFLSRAHDMASTGIILALSFPPWVCWPRRR